MSSLPPRRQQRNASEPSEILRRASSSWTASRPRWPSEKRPSRTRARRSRAAEPSSTRAVATVSSGLRLAGTPVPGNAGASSHLLFLPGDAYRLVEADGDAPGLDTEIQTEDGSYLVVRVGRSPLPGDPRTCAFLELRPG